MADALPDLVRDWTRSHAPSEVVDIAPIGGGGITDTKWLVTLADGDRLVLRWSDPNVWGEVGREHVRREALACRLLAGSDLPVPRLLATVEDANLLTWLPGRVRLDPLSTAAIEAWAQLAVEVHRQPVADGDRPPTFSFRGPTQPEVPPWTRRPEVWRRAIEVLSGGPPPTPYGLIHRDFHLGNVLWEGDAVSGLVDWAETSWGPPDLDVAHACSDLAMLHTLDDAEAFREAYAHAGCRLDPDLDASRFWTVADVVGFLPDPAHVLPAFHCARPELTADDVRTGLEDLLAATLG